MYAALVLAVTGISLAGLAASVPLWVLALALAAVGIGLANTGSLGLLIDAVPMERIVSAMVVWSQVGIVGYLLGPLAGGVIAEQFGYALIGLVPAAAAAVLLLRPDVLPLRRQSCWIVLPPQGAIAFRLRLHSRLIVTPP